MNFVIILAGGKGTRCKTDGAMPKQLLPLGDNSIINHTISHFENNDDIDIILVVANNDFCHEISAEINKANFTKLSKIVPGGATYYDSLSNGLVYLKNNYSIAKDDIVTIHGACCPFANDEIIKDNISVAAKYGSAAASPDTTTSMFCIDSAGYAFDSIDRTKVRNSQFPYSYKFGVISSALDKFQNIDKTTFNNHPIFINEGKIALSKGSWMNIKITTEEDYKTAKIIFAGLNLYDKNDYMQESK